MTSSTVVKPRALVSQASIKSDGSISNCPAMCRNRPTLESDHIGEKHSQKQKIRIRRCMARPKTGQQLRLKFVWMLGGFLQRTWQQVLYKRQQVNQCADCGFKKGCNCVNCTVNCPATVGGINGTQAEMSQMLLTESKMRKLVKVMRGQFAHCKAIRNNRSASKPIRQCSRNF
jgi:hypothetical protein